MAISSSQPRVSTCQIERGLYALRYVESTSDPCPVATIRPRSGLLDLIAAPGEDVAVLRRPGQALVILANAPAVFDITLTAVGRTGSYDSNFSLDLLDSGVDDGRSATLPARVDRSSAPHRPIRRPTPV